MACLTEWTPKKQQKFLDALAEYGIVTTAARIAKCSKQTAYNHRNNDPGFAELWDEAVDSACDLLEEEARRRAYNGTTKPIYQQGQCVGEIQEYSDTLMIFLLKGARPEKYRENASIKHEFVNMSDAELIEAAKSTFGGMLSAGAVDTQDPA